MADARLKTGLALVTRCQGNDEAVGRATVQVGCQMTAAGAVNERTKVQFRPAFVESSQRAESKGATKQIRTRVSNINFALLSRGTRMSPNFGSI